ncbi:hypothetical protein [Rhodococcus sp. IEGM 1330]|uniref:hypothetical protein n=1 Tax=Rhodococcus sp. IEGM 1330 TaxID=3082225 RepID=UPI002954DF17|nr:hypothetical protein [Rhodococcus sp. IEGM 1330]MDV8025336.1 hypothetical protein [Rhodococcus sp. IEGM 1330]
MTEPGPRSDGTDAFEVSLDAAEQRDPAGAEATQVCRAAAIGLHFAPRDSDLLLDSAAAIEELGFPTRPALQEEGLDWATVPFADVLGTMDTQFANFAAAWQHFNSDPTPQAATAVLIAQLGSTQVRESTAAAAVLWRVLRDNELNNVDVLSILNDFSTFYAFDLPAPTLFEFWPEAGPARVREYNESRWRESYSQGSRYTGTPLGMAWLWGLVRWRIVTGLADSDPVVRQLAHAALASDYAGGAEIPADSVPPRPPIAGSPLAISTMVHGTFGWKGEWWRPQGDFHQFIRQNHRPNLYERGARFSWSGAYSHTQRRLAADDLADWAADVAPHGIESLFAHSYGADVAARAVGLGFRLHELVCLSAPVTPSLRKLAGMGVRIIDIRLKFDPILAIALTPQHFPTSSHVTPVVLRAWRLNHSSTHTRHVWEEEGIAARAGI